MYFLKALEFAFGAFLVVFVIWQIIAPLLNNEKPFPAFRKPSHKSPTRETKHV